MMGSADLETLEAAAAALRSLPPGERPAREVARAQLDLARAYEAAGREDDALAASRVGIEALSPAFLAEPAALADAMRELVTQYVAIGRHARTRPDEALLQPIAQALGDLARAEDAGDGE